MKSHCPPLRVRRLVLLLLATALPFAAGAAELKLRILETTDVHMNLLAWDYYQDKVADDYGLARTITLIKAARAETRNSVLFDNGDLIEGSPLGDEVARVQPLKPGEVHPAIKVLNALGVDAGNIGNHEFNYGLPFLKQVLAGAKYPVVNANVFDAKTGRNTFTPWVMLKRRFIDEAGKPQVLKIGVVGFVPPQIMEWDRGNLAGRVVTHDIVETARQLVPQIRAAGADLVVAIPHSGFERTTVTPPMAENTVARIAEVPGIDAILFGHSHGEFPGSFFTDYPKADVKRGTINGVPAVMPGFWGSHLGVIDLVLDDSSGHWKVKDGRGEIRPVFHSATKQPVAADALVEKLVGREHAATLDTMRAQVATTSVPIQSYFAAVADDPSVQLVSQAQLAYVKRAVQGTDYEKLPLLSAAAPFKTGGRMGWTNYTDIPAGPIALRNVADLYVYPNTVKAVLLTGAQVREWLEMSAGEFNRIDPQGPPEQELLNPAFVSYNFDTIDGVTYRIDITQPARYGARDGKLLAPDAHRIVDLRYNGQPIDANAKFLVVTNNYRASGGGHFPGLDGSTIVIDAPDENRAALVDYLRAAGHVDPSADDNWHIVPVPGVKLRFTAGTGGIAHLARYPAIHLVKDNGDGSATFELQP